MAFERSIKVAFDKISGEILQADEVFDGAKNAFATRKQFHKDEVELYCCECEQKLNVSGSKYDRLHFKHGQNSEPCLLKDNKLSPEETKQLTRIYQSKESVRHKQLKNEIGQKLSQIEGVQSIQIDDKFIIDGKERRKPDVYCQYFDKKLVFEIQLSDLSLRYIINRHDFYKRNKMYLIWVLDNFDPRGQSQTERDIKYLTEHQNFFRLDEKTEEFKLICTYKYPFLTDENRLLSKWLEKSIRLNQVKFSSSLFQIFYFNYGQGLKLREREQEKREREQEEAERRQREIERRERAEQKVNWVLDQLRERWIKQSVNFDHIQEELRGMSSYQISVLKDSPAFKPKNGQPRIHHWFSNAQRDHFQFLGFMLECQYLNFDVNELSKTNTSLLSTLFDNESVKYKMWLTRKILKRGYVFKKEDEALITQLNYDNKTFRYTLILCYSANQLSNKSLVEKLFEHGTLVCIIESARRKKIVGFKWKPDQWIAFANNAIHAYKEYWDYIEIAFRHFGIWDLLISLDKKGSFRKKLDQYYSTLPKQNFDCDRLFRELYPELEY